MPRPDPFEERTSSEAGSPARRGGDRGGLTELERDILAFERDRLRHVGAKEEAIRLRFGLSGARYYQLLNALIDTPAAVVHDPMLVRRLQRIRDSRVSARVAGARGRRDPGRPRTD